VVDWLAEILKSEFVAGVLLGVFLTGFGHWVSLCINRQNQKKVIIDFCLDTINNVSGYVKSLNEVLDISKNINMNDVDLIDIEIGVYGRNREHLIYITDENYRKDIREFFSKVAIQTSKIRNNISLCNESKAMRNGFLPGNDQYNFHDKNVVLFWQESVDACKKLDGLKADSSSLIHRK